MRSRPISLSPKSANKLAKLWNELSVVPSNGFNQDSCKMCIIGHGIRSGAMNGFHNPDRDFSDAVKWVGIKDTDVERYLFGTLGNVRFLADWNGWPAPIGGVKSIKSAQARIEFVLDAAGYELVE